MAFPGGAWAISALNLVLDQLRKEIRCTSRTAAAADEKAGDGKASIILDLELRIPNHAANIVGPRTKIQVNPKFQNCAAGWFHR